MLTTVVTKSLENARACSAGQAAANVRRQHQQHKTSSASTAQHSTVAQAQHFYGTDIFMGLTPLALLLLLSAVLGSALLLCASAIPCIAIPSCSEMNFVVFSLINICHKIMTNFVDIQRDVYMDKYVPCSMY